MWCDQFRHKFHSTRDTSHTDKFWDDQFNWSGWIQRLFIYQYIKDHRETVLLTTTRSGNFDSPVLGKQQCWLPNDKNFPFRIILEGKLCCLWPSWFVLRSDAARFRCMPVDSDTFKPRWSAVGVSPFKCVDYWSFGVFKTTKSKCFLCAVIVSKTIIKVQWTVGIAFSVSKNLQWNGIIHG